MSRSVNEVEGIVGAVNLMLHLYGVALYGDAALTFQVHIVKHLRLHVLAGHRVGELQQTVGQR